MTTAATNRRYRSTESKDKDGGHEMYVTYGLEQKTRGRTKRPIPQSQAGIYCRRRQGLEGGARSEEDGA